MILRHLRSMTMVAAVAVAAAFTPARAATILPPGSSYAGKSIADWTAAWWTWAFQLPAATNPLSDKTGAYANLNNNGPVFFVAGTDGNSGPAATRSFSVPDGRPILLPMINFFGTEPSPPIDPNLDDRKTSVDLTVGAFLGAVDTASLFATIDGVPVANPASYLEVTGIFSAGPTVDGSYYAALGVPAGTDGFPTKAAGYWLMISGLAPGPHELRFGGAAAEWSVDTPSEGIQGQPAFSTNTTAFITVIPEPGSALLLATMLALLLVPSRVSVRRN